MTASVSSLTAPYPLSSATFSHYLCLGEFNITAVICKLFGTRAIGGICKFWSTLPEDNPMNEAPMRLFKWAVKCHMRRFFDDPSPMGNPQGALIESFLPNIKPTGLSGLCNLYRLIPTQFAAKIRSQGIGFVTAVCRSAQADPFDVAFVVSFFDDIADQIDFKFIFWSRFYEFRAMCNFYEGLFSTLKQSLIAVAHEHSKRIVLFPEDLPLALCHLTESKRRHFVDFDIVSAVFPTFSILKFLRKFDTIPPDEISLAIASLPEEFVAMKFHLQLRLCRVLALPSSWSLLKTSSVPSLIRDPVLYQILLQSFPRDSCFVDISQAGWARDHDFMRAYLAIADFLSASPPSQIPEVVIVDCFSLLFLQKDGRFVFSYGDVLQRLTLLRESCPLLHPLQSFLDNAADHCSLVSKLTDRPTIEKVLMPKNLLFLALLTDTGREHLLSLKGFVLPLFARSAIFQTLLLSEHPAATASLSDIERHLMGMPPSHQPICLLDFLSAHREFFAIPNDTVNDPLFEAFCKMRSEPPPSPAEFSPLDFAAPSAAFLEQLANALAKLPDGILRSFLAHVGRLVRWGARDASAADLLGRDFGALIRRCTATVDSVATAMTLCSQIDLDFGELLFSDYASFELPDALLMELTLMFPQAMFFHNRAAALDRLTGKTDVIAKWASRSNSVTTISASLSWVLQKKSLFAVDARNPQVLAAIPLVVEGLSLQQTLSELDCRAFEDLLYQADLAGSWQSIGQLCKRMQAQFNRPLFDVFAVLSPLDQREHFAVYEVSPSDRSRPKNVFSAEADFMRILSNPALLLPILDNRKLVTTEPDVIARLCTLQMFAFGRSSFLERVLVCAKIQLFLGPKLSAIIADDVVTFDPETVIKKIVSRISLHKAIEIGRAVQPINCRKFVEAHLPEDIVFMKLLQDPLVIEELAISVIQRIEVVDVKQQLRWIKLLKRLRHFIQKGRQSSLLYQLASDLLACPFCLPFDLRTFRNVPQIAERYGMTSTMQILSTLDSHITFSICPHFVVVPHLTSKGSVPIGSSPALPELSFDETGLVTAFAARDSSIGPIFYVSHFASQVHVFRHDAKTVVCQRLNFSDLIARSPMDAFSRAISANAVCPLCDAYASANQSHVLWDFFCRAAARALWHTCAAIARWMASRASLFLPRFPYLPARTEFFDLLGQLFASGPSLELHGVPLPLIFPPEYLSAGTLADLRRLLELHELQRGAGVSLFAARAAEDLMAGGSFELAFRVAHLRGLDATPSFFQLASADPPLCAVLLRVLPHLTDAQLETAVQLAAPLLEVTAPRDAIDRFMRQLIAATSDEPRVFRLLLWFGRHEEALIYAAFRGLRGCLCELEARAGLRGDALLAGKCRRVLDGFT
jgi:hypothetical protein